MGDLSKVCSQMFSKMLILGTNWTTRYSMVREQICTINHEMDQSLWQTPESIDFLHSSHMWIQTILSCGKHCKTMQIGTVSKLRFCWRSWGLKLYFRWNIVHFRKPYVCSNKLDVQETNCRFAQFNRIRNHLLGCRIEVRRAACSGIMGSDRHGSSRKHASE